MTAAQSINIQDLQAENSGLKQDVEAFKKENSYLKQQLEWFKKHVFGQRRERVIDNEDQLKLFPELAEEPREEEKPVQPHTRRVSKKGSHTLSFPDDLPVERIVVDLPEKEKVCAVTGKALQQIGEEVSRKLAYKPGSYYIKEYVRPKYGTEEGVHIAEMPDQIIPKCRADESFLAEVVVRKFADHLPLYRIAEILSREDVSVSRQLLSQWIVALGKAVTPLCEELKKQIKTCESLHIDESPVKLQVKGNGKTHQASMCVMVAGAGPPYRHYTFHLSRKHGYIHDLLCGYHGHLHSDKWGAYETLARKKQYTWCICIAHLRRKFVEAEEGPVKTRILLLRKLKYLFMLERIAKRRTAEERQSIRKEKEEPIIDEIISVMKEELANPSLLPRSRWGQAIGYGCSLIPYVKNYLTHPEASLDNNKAERAIRPLALGRKNWLFVGSEEGGKAAANLLSLVQTCRELKINPREYLEDVFRRLMSHSNQRLEELLPDKWAESRSALHATTNDDKT